MKTADVVVPVYADLALTERCLRSVLELSGKSLARLIVVDDRGPSAGMGSMLEALRAEDPRVYVLQNERNLGFVASCNRGLALRTGDVVLLNSDTQVTPGWLEELLAVLHLDPLHAAVSPLSNNATLCSVPNYIVGSPVARLAKADLHLSGLPRFTAMPTGVGFCLALKGRALDLVGAFDPAYGRGYHEENDLCQRLRSRGFSVVRANHALVLHHGQVSFGPERARLDAHNVRRLVARYPAYLEDNRAFEEGPHARVAAIGAAGALGPLRVSVHTEGAEAPSWVAALQGRRELEVRASLDRPTPARRVEVVHLVGTPSSAEALRAYLVAPGHLVLSLDSLAPLTDDAFGLGGAPLELLLEAAAAVIVPTQEAKKRLGPWRRDVDVISRQLRDAPALPPAGPVVHLATAASRDNEALVLEAFAQARALPGGEELTLVLTAPDGPSYPLPGVVRAAGAGLEGARVVLVTDVSDFTAQKLARARESCGRVIALDVPAHRELAGPGVQLVPAWTAPALAAALVERHAARSAAPRARNPAEALAALYQRVASCPPGERLQRRAQIVRIFDWLRSTNRTIPTT